MVCAEGFEPPIPRAQGYSLLRLSNFGAHTLREICGIRTHLNAFTERCLPETANISVPLTGVEPALAEGLSFGPLPLGYKGLW